MKELDGLFGVGQRLKEAEDQAIWALRHKYGIGDDSPDGWQTLALILARQHIPGFPYSEAILREIIAQELMGKARPKSGKSQSKKRRGPKPTRGPKARAMLLDWVEAWKYSHRRKGGPKRTDKDAFKTLKKEHPDLIAHAGPRTFCNLVSKARKDRKKRKRAALVDALMGNSRGFQN